MNYGPLYKEYNNIILGHSFDHIELISERKKRLKKEHMVKLKSICSPQFAFEIVCLCILPFPFYDTLVLGAEFETSLGKKHVVYWLSDVMFAFMFIRLAFLFRTLLSYSQYSGVYSKSLCRKYGFSSNVRFALKCSFTMYPERSFVTVFSSSVIVLAYLTRIWEIPYLKEINEGDPYESDFFQQIWLVCMTLFTVGYGDVTPHTFAGKILAIFVALWGAFLISFLVVTVTNIFALTQSQLKAHKHIIYSLQAAKTVGMSVKYFLLKKKYYILKIKRDPSCIKTSPFLEMVMKRSMRARTT